MKRSGKSTCLVRQTHMYCLYCMTNLHDYGQTSCVNCLLVFDKAWLVSDMFSDKLSLYRRIQCFFMSVHLKSKQCCR